MRRILDANEDESVNERIDDVECKGVDVFGIKGGDVWILVQAHGLE